MLLVIEGESPGGAPSTVVRVSEAEYAVARLRAVPVCVFEKIAQSPLAALDATQHWR